MNPELLNRMQAGSFVKIIFGEEVPVSGYIASDPADADALRLDGYFLGPEGSLQEISLKLFPEDISSVDFLPESPVFTDNEDQSITMPAGFFKHLD